MLLKADGAAVRSVSRSVEGKVVGLSLAWGVGDKLRHEIGCRKAVAAFMSIKKWRKVATQSECLRCSALQWSDSGTRRTWRNRCWFPLNNQHQHQHQPLFRTIFFILHRTNLCMFHLLSLGCVLDKNHNSGENRVSAGFFWWNSSFAPKTIKQSYLDWNQHRKVFSMKYSKRSKAALSSRGRLERL